MSNFTQTRPRRASSQPLPVAHDRKKIRQSTSCALRKPLQFGREQDGARYFGAVYSRRAMTASSAPLALYGVRLVDLSRVLASPYCGSLRGDRGPHALTLDDTSVAD